MALWQHEIKKRDGRYTCAREGHSPDSPDTRLGYRELMQNLAWARDHCEGRFRVIEEVAKDKNAKRRSTVSRTPSRMVMRLTHLDESRAAFAAEAEDFV